MGKAGGMASKTDEDTRSTSIETPLLRSIISLLVDSLEIKVLIVPTFGAKLGAKTDCSLWSLLSQNPDPAVSPQQNRRLNRCNPQDSPNRASGSKRLPLVHAV